VRRRRIRLEHPRSKRRDWKRVALLEHPKNISRRTARRGYERFFSRYFPSFPSGGFLLFEIVFTCRIVRVFGRPCLCWCLCVLYRVPRRYVRRVVSCVIASERWLKTPVAPILWRYSARQRQPMCESSYQLSSATEAAARSASMGAGASPVPPPWGTPPEPPQMPPPPCTPPPPRSNAEPPSNRVVTPGGVSDWLHYTILAVIYWCFLPYIILGLALPGVGLVTWTILAVINWCFDCK
jgi:hypothetical protein